MKRFFNIVGLVLGIALTLGMTVYAFANASKADKMVGVVTTAKAAAVEVMDQPDARGSIMVASVKVPGPSWIAVHLDDNGMPGERIGLQAIPAGDSSDVEVKIDDVKLTDKLIVAVHADRGVAGRFEFSKAASDASPDKPYFVDDMELAMEISVATPPFGVKANSGEATITVVDQLGATGAITVARATAPTAAFVVVHLDVDGKPGARVGSAAIPAGTSANVRVTLDPSVALTDQLLVAVHADRGVAGTLEFDMMDKYNSPDQPFFVNGQEVAAAVRVK